MRETCFLWAFGEDLQEVCKITEKQTDLEYEIWGLLQSMVSS